MGETMLFHNLEFERMNDESIPIANRNALPLKRYWEPRQCPHCRRAIGVQPSECVALPYEKTGSAIILSYRCRACHRSFLVVSHRETDGQDLELIEVVPVAKDFERFPKLKEISPEFCGINEEAYSAYNRGWFRLAAIGFRTAIEVLMKDFLISKNAGGEEEIVKLRLNDLIEKYFKHMAMGEFARAIQVLGNDCTHYIRKHEDYNPEDVERFYKMFVTLLSLQNECQQL